jgi:small subunit ribosomal protein S2
MGVCTACSAEVADDTLAEGKCPNCAGGAEAAPAAEAPAEAAAEAPAEAPAEAAAEAPAEAPAAEEAPAA